MLPGTERRACSPHPLVLSPRPQCPHIQWTLLLSASPLPPGAPTPGSSGTWGPQPHARPSSPAASPLPPGAPTPRPAVIAGGFAAPAWGPNPRLLRSVGTPTPRPAVIAGGFAAPAWGPNPRLLR